MEGFTRSPFLLTATPETGATWAGRPQLKSKVERLARSLVVRPDSTLDVVWANFGSGKSHVLYYIAHLLQEQAPTSVPVFVETPEQIKNFLELYRRLMPKLPWRRLVPILNADESLPRTSQLKRVARVIEHGNDNEQALAYDWLFAASVNLRDLKTFVGVQARIDTDMHAADVLGELLASLSRQEMRVILLFDEFQRIGALSEKYRWAVLSNLRSLFTHNPTHLSVILAAATRLEKTAMDLLPSELKTLIGPRPIVSLPEMDTHEAIEFVQGRLASFRPACYRGDAFFPLQKAIVEEAIRFLASETNAKLIPRTILQALSVIYDEYLLSGEPLSSSAAKSLLKSLSWQEA
jgi:Cdc6-like AAA superfamily ATPase